LKSNVTNIGRLEGISFLESPKAAGKEAIFYLPGGNQL
jgi:hypothetical protein